MATTEHVLSNDWTAVHASTQANTNVVLTSYVKGVRWAVGTATPPDTLRGHSLSQWDRVAGLFIDRGFILNNGETMYLRGPQGKSVAVTVSTS